MYVDKQCPHYVLPPVSVCHEDSQINTQQIPHALQSLYILEPSRNHFRTHQSQLCSFVLNSFDLKIIIQYV